MSLWLTTGDENGLLGASQRRREGQGFSPAVKLHTLTPPLSRERERGDHEVVGEGPNGGAEAPPFRRDRL